MLLNPSILALSVASLAVSGLLLLAGVFCVQVLRHWDITSGSERQLSLERRTYLISTLMAFAFLSEILSLLLFVYTAEALSEQFVGAMCATGVLNANPWGWPALYLKMAVFIVGGVWLMVNRVDRQGRDYPLVRPKYALLLALIPLVWAETAVQILFFLELDPDVITSCCGALFTPEGSGVAAEITGTAPGIALAALYLSAAVLLGSGLWLMRRRTGGMLFAALGLFHFVSALVAVVSCFALYVYEHPHHHCPFCLLKPGHDYIGYWLYLPLFAATAWSMGVGTINHWRYSPGIAAAVATDSIRFTRLSLAALILFHGVAAWTMLNSGLTMHQVWW